MLLFAANEFDFADLVVGMTRKFDFPMWWKLEPLGIPNSNI